MAYFWVKHKVTGEITVANYAGQGKWRHIGKLEAEVGLLEYYILKEIELLVEEERPPHEQRMAVIGTLTMTKSLNVGDTSTATLSFADKAGNPVQLPSGNIPVWTVDQTALLGLAVAADGMSAVCTAQAVGLATITVKAEGDPTPGVDTITVTGSVTIVDEASSGEITFS